MKHGPAVSNFIQNMTCTLWKKLQGIGMAKAFGGLSLIILLMHLHTSLTLGAAPTGYVDAASFGYTQLDATNALQAAINTGMNVYVADVGHNWIVRPLKLTNSNQQILFENGVVIEAMRGAFLSKTDSLFYASYNVTNISLVGYGARLVMHQEDYSQSPYAFSEHRAGISLGSASNVTVAGLTIKDTGGDGIYVGGSSDSANMGLPAINITIKDVTIDNAYRNGISVVDAKNVTIDNAVILNTSGTKPQAGIDLEPDLPSQVLENITIKNSIINANASQGILVSLYNMPGGAVAPITGSVDHVTIMGNGEEGILMTKVAPGFTITNSLILDNGGPGVAGVSLDIGEASGSSRNAITFSNLHNNAGGATSGWIALGTGSQMSAPLFHSTNPSDPHYMCLAQSTTELITHGANDGTYMGARPVYVPEPNLGAVVAGAAIAFCVLRRRRSTKKHVTRCKTTQLSI